MGKTPAERVRDTVRFNTGGPQPDAIAEHHVRVILVGNGPLTVDKFEAGLEEALDKGWVEWTDRGRLTVLNGDIWTGSSTEFRYTNY